MKLYMVEVTVTGTDDKSETYIVNKINNNRPLFFGFLDLVSKEHFIPSMRLMIEALADKYIEEIKNYKILEGWLKKIECRKIEVEFKNW